MRDDTDESQEKELDSVYRERNLLACTLATLFESHAYNMAGWCPAPDTDDEWAIVWIYTPFGQLSWHVPREMADELGPPQAEDEWDGHSTTEKNDRLASWANDGCEY